jgi:hypothetical protein
MLKVFNNITGKFVSVTAVFAVIMLNLSAVVQCGNMLINDDCCHVKNLVKPCCVKNLKITANHRITGHCGCSIKEAQQVDLYIDLSSNNHKNSKAGVTEFENYSTDLTSYNTDIRSENYSPPVFSENDVYLTNLSLRI